MTTTNQSNLLITLSGVFLWLVLTASMGWWLWSNYRHINQPDIAQVQEAKTQLDIDKLSRAVELLNQ